MKTILLENIYEDLNEDLHSRDETIDVEEDDVFLYI